MTEPNESEQPQGGRFYYASSYNLPGLPGGGAKVAEVAIPRLEELFDAECTSKWPFDFQHGEPWYALKAAMTDVKSVEDADFLLFVPLTKTSRGTHVELGMAVSAGLPAYGHRFAEGDDGTAFDALVKPLPDDAVSIILGCLTAVKRRYADEPARMPAPMPKVGEHDAN